MDFTLEISTDKQEIAHPRNVARALERLARELDNRFELSSDVAEAEGVVRDVSGAIVGRWTMRRSGSASK